MVALPLLSPPLLSPTPPLGLPPRERDEDEDEVTLFVHQLPISRALRSVPMNEEVVVADEQILPMVLSTAMALLWDRTMPEKMQRSSDLWSWRCAMKKKGGTVMS